MLSLTNLSALVGLSVLAVFLVVAIVSTLGAPFGLEVVYSPLLLTLAASILVTELIAIFTAVISHKSDRVRAGTSERKAVVTFIFANSLSALAVLTNSFMETVELKEVTAVNGLSLLLDVWLPRQSEQFVATYRDILGIITIFAFLLALRGTTLFSSNQDAEHSQPVASILLSLLLMIFSALIGTHWNEVPFESREILGTWGSIVTWGTALALFVLTLSAALAITFATLRAISLSIFGVVRDGRRIVHSGIMAVLGLVSWEVIKGTLFGLGLIVALLALINLGSLLATGMPSIAPETEIRAIGVALDRLNLLVVPVMQKIVLPLLVLALIGLLASRLLTQLIRLYRWLRCRAKHCRARVQRIIACFANAVSAINFPKVNWDGRIPWLLAGGRRIFITGALLVQKSLDHSASLTRLPVVGLCLLAAASTLAYEEPTRKKTGSAPQEDFVGSSKSDGDQSKWFYRLILDTVEIGQKAEIESVPVVEPKTDWNMQAVRVCDTAYLSPQWLLGSTEYLKIPLYSCRLNNATRQSEGILVVVGAASFETGTSGGEREVIRAINRGLALADWASGQVSSSQKILVLNLGMAKSRYPQRSADSLFSSLTFERPATAILLSPPASGDPVDENQALDDLYSLLEKENFERDFTNCELFQFDRSSRSLGAEPLFACQRGNGG